MTEPQKNDAGAPFTAYAVFGAAGIQFAMSVVAGLLFGNYLDKKIGTTPWLTIIGIVLGFTGGLVNLFRIIRWFNRKKL